MVGVTFRMVPTSSRWMVWKALPVPLVVRVLAGEERHFLRHFHLRFLVVARDHLTGWR